MKLTPVNKKLKNSIRYKMHYDVYYKLYDSTSDEIYWKIHDETWRPNLISISRIQQRILRNLQDEINSSK